MRYFVMSRKDIYKPRITLPYSIKKQLDIKSGKVETIDNTVIWQMEESSFTFFSDILTEPLLLLSDRAKEVLQIYDRKTVFKRIILFCEEKGTVKLYYIPLLPEIKGLQKGKNQIEIGREDESVLKKVSIMKLKVKERVHFLANLEVMESFLKRRLTGIDIEAADIVVNGRF